MKKNADHVLMLLTLQNFAIDGKLVVNYALSAAWG